MPQFTVQCRERDGALIALALTAADEADARRQAEAKGHTVEFVGPAKWQKTSKVEPGAELGNTAMTLSLIGLLIPLAALAGVVMGGIARERSGGKHGGPAIGLGVTVLVLWGLGGTVLVLW